MVAGSKRFGAYLRAIRDARRLSLDDVERRTLDEAEPISRSLLSRMENGKARISAVKIMSLARIYRVRPTLLMERLEVDHETETLRSEGLDGWPTAKLLNKAAEAGRSGQVHRALVLYEQAELRELERSSDEDVLARARLGVARALYAAGKPRLARDVLEQMLAESLRPTSKAWAFYLLAKVCLDTGQSFVARAAAAQLETLGERLPEEIAACLPLFRATFLDREGRLDDAFGAWLEALDAARRAAQPAAEARAMLSLASIERRRGRGEPGQAWAERALDLAETHGLATMKVAALTERGRLHVGERRPDLARRAWTTARRLARTLDLHQELFEVYAELWRLAEKEGHAREAASAMRTLRRLVRFLDGIPLDMDDVRERLDRPEEGPATVSEEVSR